MDVAALRNRLRNRRRRHLVATMGTTATGSVDPLHEILALRDGTASASTPTPRMAATLRWRKQSRRPAAAPLPRSPKSIPSSSTHTSTDCSLMAAAASSSAIPSSAAFTSTIPPTPTSPPPTSIWAKSASNARDRELRPQLSGPPNGCFHSSPRESSPKAWSAAIKPP